MLTADVLSRERGSESPLTSSGLAYWTLAIAGSAWFSQSLARVSGLQVYTLALIGLGTFLLRQTNRSTSVSANLQSETILAAPQ